jgi:hypothetical protein
MEDEVADVEWTHDFLASLTIHYKPKRDHRLADRARSARAQIGDVAGAIGWDQHRVLRLLCFSRHRSLLYPVPHILKRSLATSGQAPQ